MTGGEVTCDSVYKPAGLVYFASGTIAVLSGILTVPLIALYHFPAIIAFVVPLFVLGAIAVVYSTRLGLCFVAFAIGPLGIVQYEFGIITLNLPEVLILLLFAKEAIRFIVRNETVSPLLPSRTFLLYIAACLAGIVVGLLNANGFVRVIQDFRQFTEYTALYLLILHRVPDRNQAGAVMGSYVVGCTLLSLHGVFQHFTGLGIPLTQALSDAVHFSGVRGGSFYGATPLGGIMVLATGTGISLALGGRSRSVRAFFAFCTVTCLVGAVFTYTRASWIAMAFSLTFIYVFIKKTTLVVTGTVVVLLAFSAVLGPMVVERIESLSFSRAESSLHERVNYYTVGWYIFRDHPVFGLGWGCYYQIPAILANERYVRPRVWPSASDSNSYAQREATVHSAYLQQLVKGGLTVLGSFLLFMFTWGRRVRNAWKVREPDERMRNTFIGVTGSLIGYLLHSSVENFFQWPVMSQSFWLLLGISTILMSFLKEEPSDELTQSSAESPTHTTGATSNCL